MIPATYHNRQLKMNNIICLHTYRGGRVDRRRPGNSGRFWSAKTAQNSATRDQRGPNNTTTNTITAANETEKKFSLDFPPGLVHDESECVKSPKRWKEIRKILEAKRKPDRKELRKRLLRRLCDS